MLYRFFKNLLNISNAFPDFKFVINFSLDQANLHTGVQDRY